ncbi:MAG: protein-L-isoaspartate(D-aspartate) O-methyltransferase [Anaerolineales bacterium]
MDSEPGFARQRAAMLATQLTARGIRDPHVLDAMGKVPRHRFVPLAAQSQAYEDRPLPILSGQTISQPYIVAYMLQALALDKTDKALEIGSGSGYQAALLAELAAEVHTIERHPLLAQAAQSALAELGYQQVHVHQGDGSKGWPEDAPYDAIIVAAGAPLVPQPLLQQLAPRGRLVIPVGEPGRQVLQLWRRVDGGFDYEELVPVAFVPLIGQYGWEK